MQKEKRFYELMFNYIMCKYDMLEWRNILNYFGELTNLSGEILYAIFIKIRHTNTRMSRNVRTQMFQYFNIHRKTMFKVYGFSANFSSDLKTSSYMEAPTLNDKELEYLKTLFIRMKSLFGIYQFVTFTDDYSLQINENYNKNYNVILEDLFRVILINFKRNYNLYRIERRVFTHTEILNAMLKSKMSIFDVQAFQKLPLRNLDGQHATLLYKSLKVNMRKTKDLLNFSFMNLQALGKKYKERLYIPTLQDETDVIRFIRVMYEYAKYFVHIEVV